MCKVNYGSVIMVDVPFDPENPHKHHGVHPYCVVSNPQCCKYSTCINALPLTSRSSKMRLPTQVEVEADFLAKNSYGLAEQLTLMSKDSLANGRLIGVFGKDQMEKLNRAIKVQLAIA